MGLVYSPVVWARSTPAWRPKTQGWMFARSTAECTCCGSWVSQGGGPLLGRAGPDHLACVTVKMPALLAHTDMDARAMASLMYMLRDFLKFLSTHAGRFFEEQYTETTPDYRAQVQKLS